MTGEAGFEIHDDGGTLFTLTADEAPWEFAADLDRAYGTRLTVWLERTYGEGKAA